MRRTINIVIRSNVFQIEPLEVAVEDLQKQSPLDKDPAERLDTGQTDGNQGWCILSIVHRSVLFPGRFFCNFVHLSLCECTNVRIYVYRSCIIVHFLCVCVCFFFLV